MSAAEFAGYVAILNVVILVSGIGTLGIFSTILYQLSKNVQNTYYLSRYLLKFTAFSAICAAGGLVLWEWLLGTSPNLAACACVVALAFSSTIPAIFIALHRGGAYNVSELSWQVLYLALVATARPTTSQQLVWIFLVSASVRTAFYVTFLVRIAEFWTPGDRVNLDWAFFRDASIASVGYVLFFRLSFYVVYFNPNGAIVATAWSWLERLLGLASAANSILNAKVAGGALSKRTIASFVAIVLIAFLGAELVLIVGGLVLEKKFLGPSYTGLATAMLLLAPGFLIFILRSNLQSVLMGRGLTGAVRTDTVVCAVVVAAQLSIIWLLPWLATACQWGLLFLVCASTLHYIVRIRGALAKPDMSSF